ncbi:MAG: purine-binding chemotaxis protein CheW [Deltaproteobacteria bacterium]|nr:purine-binding chemotaxis protein CheW [Deltaproteobacteria bacterium]
MSPDVKPTQLERLLEEALAAGGDAPVVETGESLKVIVFRLGTCFCALPGSEVKEILPAGEISPVPGAPDFLPGIINVRGDIESVLDIRQFLGLHPEPIRSPLILLAESGGVRSGILVEEVLDVTDVPASSMAEPLPTLPEGRRTFVAGEFPYGSRSVTFLNGGALLASGMV